MARYKPSPEEAEALEKTGWTHDADGWWRPPLEADDFDIVFTFKEAIERQRVCGSNTGGKANEGPEKRSRG
jgi:hypothetical protein